MAALTFVLLVIVMQQCVLVHSSATVGFWFRSWSNPDHSELDGGCCDPGWSCNSCDNYFIVCLDEDVPGSNDFNDCGIASITTDVFDNNDEFDFPSVIPNNIANPKPISVISWQGRMRVKLRVWDQDNNDDDLIEEDFMNIILSSSASLSSAQWVEYAIGTHSDFTFRVRVYCNSNYYTSDCSVYCVPTDNQNGHYSCDTTTGERICFDGWEGIDCSEDHDECQSGPCLHGSTCHNGMNQFSCFCTDGWTGDRCDVDVNQCETNPCYNNGTCNDFLGFYNCSCDPDYTYIGDLCEIDDCVGQPCLNGSTCIDLVGYFSCSCALGFEGDLCDVDIDECAGTPCVNGGNCTDNLGWFNCTCPPGYEGELCEIDIDECQSNPCSNSSTCENLTNRFVCLCPDGFVGITCLDEVDECEPEPCQNNASCIDYIGYFGCNCSTGFFGDLCEVDIDYCINQTCANNGTCVDRLDGFHCLCETGYEGAVCDVETDECASDPCMHNATCHDLIADYRCTCQDGYEGMDCDVETDECQSSPCRNNSTCIDQLAGYHCQCAAGFEGTWCDTDTDECQSFPCYDNETCIDVIDGYRCVDGIDMCQNHVCQNNATCHDNDRGSGYSCVCLPGYDGNLCEYNKDECDSSPCLYGTCEDLANGFSCHCIPGYDGVRCDNDTDDCANTPCEHGRCVDLVNGFECVCTVECENGQCDDGVCRCADGFEGDDCNTETDYCFSSPCAEGTCVPLFDSFRCECDPFHEGEYCKQLTEDPCSLSPCTNGQCSPSDGANDGFECSCNDGLYGPKCDLALKDYGCVILLIGIFSDIQDFEKNMAGLLELLMTSALARSRNNITVDVVKTEDYVRSDTKGPLTRVTYVALSSAGYLTNAEVEKVVSEAPSGVVNQQLGREMYSGKAEPKPLTKDNQSWASSHWYVFLLVVLAIVAIAATMGGLIRTRQTRGIFQIGWFKKLQIVEELDDDGYYNVLSDLGEDSGNQTDNAVNNPTNGPGSVNGVMGSEYAETAISNIYYEVPQDGASFKKKSEG